MTSFQPQISVIIPVYNTSKYVKKCVKSISTQTVTDLEIIIVDDCSTDNSLEIITQLAYEDKRIKIINKENNEGLELARRTGLQIAKGNYIYHVDSDDWLVPRTLHILLEEALNSHADIVSANFYRTLDGFGIIKQKSKVRIQKRKSVDEEMFLNNYYKNFFGINLFPVSMCGKLYKKSFLDNLKINLLGFNMGEDLNYNIQVFPKANKIIFLPLYVYNYRFGGMTSNFNEGIMDSALKMYVIKKQYIAEYELDYLNKYIICELKNYLKSYIEMFFKFKTNIPVLNEKVIRLLHTAEFKDVIMFYLNNEINNEEFTKALILKDTIKLIQLSQEKIQNEKFKNMMKRTIFKFLPN